MERRRGKRLLNKMVKRESPVPQGVSCAAHPDRNMLQPTVLFSLLYYRSWKAASRPQIYLHASWQISGEVWIPSASMFNQSRNGICPGRSGLKPVSVFPIFFPTFLSFLVPGSPRLCQTRSLTFGCLENYLGSNLKNTFSWAPPQTC